MGHEVRQADLDSIAQELNERPRQSLSSKAPSQALAETLHRPPEPAIPGAVIRRWTSYQPANHRPNTAAAIADKAPRPIKAPGFWSNFKSDLVEGRAGTWSDSRPWSTEPGHEKPALCRNGLLPWHSASSLLAYCDMRTLYLRNVPDDVVARLERLAARDATSVGAVAVRELAEVSRRADNPALLGSLPDFGVNAATILHDLDAGRAGR